MLFGTSSGEPITLPVGFVQIADDDSPAGAGVDKFIVFQIHSDVVGCSSGAFPVEEYQVAFLQLAFADFPAVVF